MGGILSSYHPVQTILSAQEPFKVTRNPLESYHMLEAAAQGDLPRIAQLLESGVNVDTPDATGRTALHLGSAEGHLEIVQYLIKHGSAINAKDRGGRDAVQEAARNGQKKKKSGLSIWIVSCILTISRGEYSESYSISG